MSLMKALGLTSSKAMLHRAARAAAAETPTEAKDICVDEPVAVGAPMSRKTPEGDASLDQGKRVDAEKMANVDRDQADKLLPMPAAKRHALAALSRRVEDGQSKVLKLLATAPPDKKAGLGEAKNKLDAALCDTQAKLLGEVLDRCRLCRRTVKPSASLLRGLVCRAVDDGIGALKFKAFARGEVRPS